MPVAQLHPGGQQVVQGVNASADGEPVGVFDIRMAAGHQARWQGEATRRRHRSHYQWRRRFVALGIICGQRRQRRQPLVNSASVHRQPFKGEHLRLGQQVHGSVFAQVGEQLIVEAPGILKSRRYRHHRTLGVVPQGSQVYRLVVGLNRQTGPRRRRSQVPQMPLHPFLRAQQESSPVRAILY